MGWPGLAQAGPGLGRAGPERRGPERLDTSEGSGHFLDESLACSLAHPEKEI